MNRDGFSQVHDLPALERSLPKEDYHATQVAEQAHAKDYS
jgi:hypothetical protein